MEFPAVVLFLKNWKETKGFLFRKAKMHSAYAPALSKFTFPYLASHLGRQASLPKTILEEGEIHMGIFNLDEVITVYSLKQAIEDGVLIEVFKSEWDELSRGKPIVASMNVYEEVSQRDLVEIWNRFVFWRKVIMPKLVERERFFSTEMNHMLVWVIDDKVCFTILYPHDY